MTNWQGFCFCIAPQTSAFTGAGIIVLKKVLTCGATWYFMLTTDCERNMNTAVNMMQKPVRATGLKSIWQRHSLCIFGKAGRRD